MESENKQAPELIPQCPRMMKCHDMTECCPCRKSTKGRTRRARRRRTRFLKMQAVPCANAAVHISLAKWMKNNTHSFKWKCNLIPAVFAGIGRGLQARCQVHSGDIIVSIPGNLLITVTSVLQSEIGEHLNRSSVKLTAQEVLSLFLILEKYKGTDSFWHPYIDSLPSTFSTLAYFSEEDFSLLPSKLKKKAQEKNHELQYHTFQKVRSFYQKYWRRMEGGFTFENFRWAWFCVNSRSVYLKAESNEAILDDGNYVALAPFLDLLNHSYTAETKAGYNETTKCYEVRTFVPYNKYEQVFISYGPHDNSHLLLEYGFTIPGNPHDVYELDFDEVVEELASLNIDNFCLKCKILRDNNFRKISCSADGLSYEFWVIFRTLAMTWIEFKAWKQVLKGEEISVDNTMVAKHLAKHLLQKCLHDNDCLIKKFPEESEMTVHQKLIYTIVKSDHDKLQKAWTEVT